MAKLALAVLAARKAANGMYPIFVRIAAKKEKAYIKTVYEISDLSQWYNGKVGVSGFSRLASFLLSV